MNHSYSIFKLCLFVFLFFPLTLETKAQRQHTVRVSFIINSSQSISPNNIFVAGNLAGMGPWQADKIPLFKSDDGSWIGTIKMPVNEFIDIRYTQGNWDYHETDPSGEPIIHHFVLTRDTVIRHRVRHWSIPGQYYFPAPSESDPNTTVNTPEVKPPPKIIKPPFQFVRRHEDLKSDGITARNATVYLPKAYETEEDRSFPVLYVHDGMQRHYSSSHFSGNKWSVPEIAKSLMDNYMMEEIIVVVIHNQNDYLFRHFSRNLNEPYRNFLTDALKPFIDRKYRTMPEPENTCTMGSDYGGLWAFALAWENSDIVGKAICFSPIFEKPRQYYAYTFQVSQTPDYKFIEVYFDNGDSTADNRKQDGLDRMMRVLNEKGINIHFHKQFEKTWDSINTKERIKTALMTIY